MRKIYELIKYSLLALYNFIVGKKSSKASGKVSSAAARHRRPYPSVYRSDSVSVVKGSEVSKLTATRHNVDDDTTMQLGLVILTAQAHAVSDNTVCKEPSQSHAPTHSSSDSNHNHSYSSGDHPSYGSCGGGSSSESHSSSSSSSSDW